MPTPCREASRAMPMKLSLSVAPTFGRSSVNSMTRVLPAKRVALATAVPKPTRSPSSIAVLPALWIRSMAASTRVLSERRVGARCT